MQERVGCTRREVRGRAGWVSWWLGDWFVVVLLRCSYSLPLPLSLLLSSYRCRRAVDVASLRMSVIMETLQ